MTTKPAFPIVALPAARPAPTAPPDPCAPCCACCRIYVVQLSGYDLWRISRGQNLAPEAFAVARVRGDAGADGFILTAHGPSYGLVLAKQGALSPGVPCTFLAGQPDGTDRCSIYADRPSACRIYPMRIWSGIVFERADAYCPPGAWAPDEAQRPSWRADLHAFTMQADVYTEVAARWNAQVAAHEPDLFTAPDYYAYLLAVYDQLAVLDMGRGAAGLAAVHATWPPVPRADSQFVTTRRGDSPWHDYLHAARAIIDSFFPAVPPLPFPTFVAGAPGE